MTDPRDFRTEERRAFWRFVVVCLFFCAWVLVPALVAMVLLGWFS